MTIEQHNHAITDLPIGPGPGRILTADQVEALIAAAGSSGAIMLRPVAPNPAQNIYGTFLEAYTAAAALNRPTTIYVNSPGTPVIVEDGIYDMTFISLVGVQTPTLPGPGVIPAAPHVLVTDAVTFQNFVNGNDNITIDHQGLAPLATFNFGVGTGPIIVRTGERGGWVRTSGNPGPMVSVTNSAPGIGVFICQLNEFSFVLGQVGEPVIEVAQLAQFQVVVERGSLQQDSLAGPAGAYFQFSSIGFGVLNLPQTDLLSTIAFASNPSGLYMTTTPAQWVGAPTSLLLQIALNRMISLLNTLNAGPIP